MSTKGPPPADGNVTRGPPLLAMEVVFTSLALITTIIRVSVRALSRQIGWDDGTITLAMILRLISFSASMVTLSQGNGRHTYYLQHQQVVNILKWTWAAEVLIFATVCLIKISICLFIFRIKKTGWLRWFLYVLMAGLIITNGSCIIVLFAQCQPLRAFWNRAAGTCWNVKIYNGFIYTSVGYSVVSDLICTTLPIIIFWKVKISKEIKYAICGLMSVGLIATGFAAARAALSFYNLSEDLTWTLVQIDIVATAEANFGIIGANLALARIVYVYVRRRRNLADDDRLTSGFDNSSKGLQSKGYGLSSTPGATNTHRSSYDKSDSVYTSSDQIALDSGITKTTNFQVTTESPGDTGQGAHGVDWFDRPLSSTIRETV